LRRQRHQEARAAIHRSRLERARVAREARAAALEAARLASAALTRPSRSSAAATMAEIDASVHVTQSSSFEAPQAHAPTSGDNQHVRLRCTRGHFLVPAPVRSGRDSFRPRCNGPCGLLLWPGTLRWMCEGVGCDLDICLECVAKDGAEGSSRGHTRCSQGHSMLFRLATAHTHLDRRCDGECRRSLGEGMWTYECAPCSLDLCAACAPGGIQPGDEPARAARAPRKRAREPPPHRARGRQMAHGDGPPRRASKGERRRNLFDGDSDGGPDSDEFSQPAAQGGAHGLCGKRPREPEESPSREAGRGLIDSHMARDRGVSAAPHLLYIRAGKVCERELARFGPLLHHLDTPAPLFLPIDPVSVSLCVARLCVRVRVCAALCAPHVVSPRDLWRCVLPRWQFNVNVNVNCTVLPVHTVTGSVGNKRGPALRKGTRALGFPPHAGPYCRGAVPVRRHRCRSLGGFRGVRWARRPPRLPNPSVRAKLRHC
jgi:hypothetical protein